ncbi:hypothetical protein HDU76_012968 [Blyttiomyces sp. JEL0837]|nr:hypothetical protein HDU76_012968 [Blyttiomyces sp. JEL0837]
MSVQVKITVNSNQELLLLPPSSNNTNNAPRGPTSGSSTSTSSPTSPPSSLTTSASDSSTKDPLFVSCHTAVTTDLPTLVYLGPSISGSIHITSSSSSSSNKGQQHLKALGLTLVLFSGQGPCNPNRQQFIPISPSAPTTIHRRPLWRAETKLISGPRFLESDTTIPFNIPVPTTLIPSLSIGNPADLATYKGVTHILFAFLRLDDNELDRVTAARELIVRKLTPLSVVPPKSFGFKGLGGRLKADLYLPDQFQILEPGVIVLALQQTTTDHPAHLTGIRCDWLEHTSSRSDAFSQWKKTEHVLSSQKSPLPMLAPGHLHHLRFGTPTSKMGVQATYEDVHVSVEHEIVLYAVMGHHGHHRHGHHGENQDVELFRTRCRFVYGGINIGGGGAGGPAPGGVSPISPMSLGAQGTSPNRPRPTSLFIDPGRMAGMAGGVTSPGVGGGGMAPLGMPMQGMGMVGSPSPTSTAPMHMPTQPLMMVPGTGGHVNIAVPPSLPISSNVNAAPTSTAALPASVIPKRVGSIRRPAPSSTATGGDTQQQQQKSSIPQQQTIPGRSVSGPVESGFQLRTNVESPPPTTNVDEYKERTSTASTGSGTYNNSGASTSGGSGRSHNIFKSSTLPQIFFLGSGGGGGGDDRDRKRMSFLGAPKFLNKRTSKTDLKSASAENVTTLLNVPNGSEVGSIGGSASAVDDDAQSIVSVASETSNSNAPTSTAAAAAPTGSGKRGSVIWGGGVNANTNLNASNSFRDSKKSWKGSSSPSGFGGSDTNANNSSNNASNTNGTSTASNTGTGGNTRFSLFLHKKSTIVSTDPKTSAASSYHPYEPPSAAATHPETQHVTVPSTGFAVLSRNLPPSVGVGGVPLPGMINTSTVKPETYPLSTSPIESATPTVSSANITPEVRKIPSRTVIFESPDRGGGTVGQDAGGGLDANGVPKDKVVKKKASSLFQSVVQSDSQVRDTRMAVEGFERTNPKEIDVKVRDVIEIREYCSDNNNENEVVIGSPGDDTMPTLFYPVRPAEGLSESYSVTAVNAYNAENPDELTISPGEVITVTKSKSYGWALGVKPSTNEQGLFPCSVFGKPGGSAVAPVRMSYAAGSNDQNKTGSMDPSPTQNAIDIQSQIQINSEGGDVVPAAAIVIDEPPPSFEVVLPDFAALKLAGIDQGVAWYDFEPRDNDELRVHPGDIIKIEELNDDGWAWGYCVNTSERGFFPLAIFGPDFGKPVEAPVGVQQAPVEAPVVQQQPLVESPDANEPSVESPEQQVPEKKQQPSEVAQAPERRQSLSNAGAALESSSQQNVSERDNGKAGQSPLAVEISSTGKTSAGDIATENTSTTRVVTSSPVSEDGVEHEAIGIVFSSAAVRAPAVLSDSIPPLPPGERESLTSASQIVPTPEPRVEIVSQKTREDVKGKRSMSVVFAESEAALNAGAVEATSSSNSNVGSSGAVSSPSTPISRHHYDHDVGNSGEGSSSSSRPSVFGASSRSMVWDPAEEEPEVRKAPAIHAYETTAMDQLNVKIGDTVTIELEETGWGWGANERTGERGWFPLSILGPAFGGAAENIIASAAVVTNKTNTNTKPDTKPVKTNSGKTDSPQQAASRVSSVKSASVLSHSSGSGWYGRDSVTFSLPANSEIALHMFEPRDDDELYVLPGDILVVGEVNEDGWAWATNFSRGRKGFFPLVLLGPKHGGPPAPEPPPNYPPHIQAKIELARQMAEAEAASALALETSTDEVTVESNEQADEGGEEAVNGQQEVSTDAKTVESGDDSNQVENTVSSEQTSVAAEPELDPIEEMKRLDAKLLNGEINAPTYLKEKSVLMELLTSRR